VPSHHSK